MAVRQMRGYSSKAALLGLLLWTHAAAVSAAEAPRSFYVEAGTYATQRESDPPAYVRNVGRALDDPSLAWLDAGLEYRLRYEYRDDDIRRPDPTDTDKPLLKRTRAWLGVRTPYDPLRFSVELTDSRENAGHYPQDNRDVNKMEPIQAYTELQFATALGTDPRGSARPLTLRHGRMAFEVLDRRLVARNEWRNTSNSFTGTRLQLGSDANDWALDAWSLRPLTRLLERLDEPNHEVRFDALILHWRRWSSLLTIEPHLFHLRQRPTLANGLRERDLLAPGLRAHGQAANAALTWDVSLMKQHGDDNGQRSAARALTAELGYSWRTLRWRPRLSGFYGYASGDEDPDDRRNQRFERFYGFARPWSADDYFIFENLRAPKLRLEFQPWPGVRVDAGYSEYRLANRRDRFLNLLAGTAANRDRSGQSGSELGQNWDLRIRFNPAQHLQATVGYSSFRHGAFVQQRQRLATGTTTDDSDFLYLELLWRWFE